MQMLYRENIRKKILCVQSRIIRQSYYWTIAKTLTINTKIRNKLKRNFQPSTTTSIRQSTHVESTLINYLAL